MDALLGIDVGTGSARAGLFDPAGTMPAQAVRPIRSWRPRPDFMQQSSDDIWTAICGAVRKAMAVAGPVTVRGIGLYGRLSWLTRDGFPWAC